MNFYLGVWNSPMAISDDEAAARYRALSDEKSVEPEFDDQVYTFYSRLTSKYPEIEMVPEDELDACPWASGLDVAGDHVIMESSSNKPRRSLDILWPLPLNSIWSVSTPRPARFTSLRAWRRRMQVNDDLKAGGGDEACLRAEK